MAVDIVIVSYNTREHLDRCLSALFAISEEWEGGNIIVVDNASSDGSPEMVEEKYGEVLLVRQSTNTGFGAANNKGFQLGKAPFVLFANPDTVVRPGSIKILEQFLHNRLECAAAGPRLVYPDGTFHPSCRRFPSIIRNVWHLSGMAARFSKPGLFQNWLTQTEHVSGAKVDMVSGACFMIKRDVMENIGGFDGKIFLYDEEMDVFLRIKKLGYCVCFVGEAIVEHHHGASSKEFGENRNWVAFHQFRSKYYCFRKHYGTFHAYLVYLSDQMILKGSAFLNRLRQKSSPTSEWAILSKKAFCEAMSLFKT